MSAAVVAVHMSRRGGFWKGSVVLDTNRAGSNSLRARGSVSVDDQIATFEAALETAKRRAERDAATALRLVEVTR